MRISTTLLYVVLFAVLAASSGCRTRAKRLDDLPPPTTRAIEVLQKPAIDLARGGAGFPLDTEKPPATIEELESMLSKAYAARLEADPNIKITADGEKLTDLQRLTIDITGSTVRTTFTPKSQPKTASATPFLRVAHLQYLANPLKYQNYDASMTLQATEARLALLPDEDKKLSLALYDCREGSARISIGITDLEQGITAAAKLRGGVAMRIKSIEARMRSQSPRNLEAEVTVNANLLLIPTRFRMVGRADVDTEFNIHFTSLAAEGDDPSGAVIAALIQGKLDKLNNKAAPLLKMPGDKIRVTDLKITLDQRLTVEVQFTGTQ